MRVIRFQMDVINALLKIKPELNHIYTEPPSNTHTGRDLGWFCREHALHIYGLAKLLNLQANICLGDFVLRRPGGESFTSIGDKNDHAWCTISKVSPVDVSFTIKYIYPDIEDVSLIYSDNHSLSSPFNVQYAINIDDKEFDKLQDSDRLLIGYNEKSKIEIDVIDLFENPFQFLHMPSPGMPTFPQIFGDDVFYAITIHCYKIVTEDIKPLYSYRNPKEAVKGIMKFNTGAKESFLRLLN